MVPNRIFYHDKISALCSNGDEINLEELWKNIFDDF